MPAKVRVEMNHEGVEALLSSAPVFNMIRDTAESIAAAAGTNFEAETSVGVRHKSKRAVAIIRPVNYEGLVEEARDKVLTRAIGGKG